MEDLEVDGRKILKKDVKVIWCDSLDCINLVQVKDKFWVILNIVMNLSVV